MALISVVIPLYNRRHLIRETLKSVSPDLHSNVSLEVIVVDDGSTDGGDKVIESEFPWVILIRQKNSGAPIARNAGLNEAKGKYILFLDSDDLIEPNYFFEKVVALETNPDVSAVYGPWEHFTTSGLSQTTIIPRHTNYPIESVPSYENHLKRLLEGWYIIPHSLLWRKSDLNEINGYDESLIINQDVDLLFRILVKKKSILGITAARALYREHSEINRTGDVSGNINKLKTILELRKKFSESLKQEGLLSLEYKKSISQFCFNYWIKYRQISPGVAEQFYEFSSQLFPNLNVKGGLFFNLLKTIIGNRKAIIIKQSLEKIKK